MFYPYQKLNNLTYDGSYWKNHKELQCHPLKKHTKFWGKGIEILQNRRQSNPTKTCQTC